ncbi:MAG: metallopeptidase family protein [bacterium]|nr:metallopeptidase family protein [bacterium]
MENFKDLVAKALDQLPSVVGEKMENVSLCVEQRPTKEQLTHLGMRRGEFLLGLYEGVPQTEWGKGTGGNLPDKITIFQKSIEHLAHSKEEVIELIQDTVKHEIKHHFGFSEEELSRKAGD